MKVHYNESSNPPNIDHNPSIEGTKSCFTNSKVVNNFTCHICGIECFRIKIFCDSGNVVYLGKAVCIFFFCMPQPSCHISQSMLHVSVYTAYLHQSCFFFTFICIKDMHFLTSVIDIDFSCDLS